MPKLNTDKYNCKHKKCREYRREVRKKKTGNEQVRCKYLTNCTKCAREFFKQLHKPSICFKCVKGCSAKVKAKVFAKNTKYPKHKGKSARNCINCGELLGHLEWCPKRKKTKKKRIVNQEDNPRWMSLHDVIKGMK